MPTEQTIYTNFFYQDSASDIELIKDTYIATINELNTQLNQQKEMTKQQEDEKTLLEAKLKQSLTSNMNLQSDPSAKGQ
jgi:hypothetical protein